NIQFGEYMTDETPRQFHPWRNLRINEVQRHFHMYFFVLVDTLEVNVQHLQFEWMHLYITQQHLLFLSIQIHGQDRSMKGFQFEPVIKTIVIQLNRLRRILSAINDPWHLSGTPQAAARTFAL